MPEEPSEPSPPLILRNSSRRSVKSGERTPPIMGSLGRSQQLVASRRTTSFDQRIVSHFEANSPYLHDVNLFGSINIPAGTDGRPQIVHLLEQAGVRDGQSVASQLGFATANVQTMNDNLVNELNDLIMNSQSSTAAVAWLLAVYEVHSLRYANYTVRKIISPETSTATYKRPSSTTGARRTRSAHDTRRWSTNWTSRRPTAKNRAPKSCGKRVLIVRIGSTVL